MGSVVVAHGLSGLVASWNMGSSWTGIKSVPPAGRFSTAGPPEKPQDNVFLRGILKKQQQQQIKFKHFTYSRFPGRQRRNKVGKVAEGQVMLLVVGV